MKDFYTHFYEKLPNSQAHHLFCERVYGRDLGQHGFADMAQLDLLLQVTRLSTGQQALDLGCVDGRISEYLADRSGAHFTGLDFIPEAIRLAQQRTAAKSEHLSFIGGDLNQLSLTPAAFDLILFVDSLYFSTDYSAMLAVLKRALKPEGQMAIFYSFGREPWVPLDGFPKAMLAPDKTPLATALSENQFDFRVWDLTDQDYALALRRKAVLTELKPLFEQEDAMFIYENRL